MVAFTIPPCENESLGVHVVMHVINHSVADTSYVEMIKVRTARVRSRCGQAENSHKSNVILKNSYKLFVFSCAVAVQEKARFRKTAEIIYFIDLYD